MNGTLTYGKVIWFPHLILQRGLGVKDLRQVNFAVHLVQPSFGELEAWTPDLEKPSAMFTHQAYDYDDRPNRSKPNLDRGAREPALVIGDGVVTRDELGQAQEGLIPVRGEPVFFQYKGYSTFLFQEEFRLIEEKLPNIQEITIRTTDGLSPFFQVLAVVKED